MGSVPRPSEGFALAGERIVAPEAPTARCLAVAVGGSALVGAGLGRHLHGDPAVDRVPRGSWPSPSAMDRRVQHGLPLVSRRSELPRPGAGSLARRLVPVPVADAPELVAILGDLPAPIHREGGV